MVLTPHGCDSQGLGARVLVRSQNYLAVVRGCLERG